jgi:hypothetical protein
MTRIIHGVSTRRPRSNFDLVEECDENSDGEAMEGSVPMFDGSNMIWSDLYGVGVLLESGLPFLIEDGSELVTEG